MDIKMFLPLFYVKLYEAENKRPIAKRGFYSIDLQFFADEEKTEKATPKKRQDARKKGQVLKSKEINSAVLLLAMFLTVKFSSPMIYEELSNYFRVVFNEYMKRDITEISTFMNFVIFTTGVFMKIMLPILVVSVLAGLISGYAQVGFLFTLEPLQFKLEKLNPINGFKHMFSQQSLVELVKSFIKISAALYIVFIYLKGEVNNVSKLVDMDVMNIFMYIGNIAINVSIAIITVLAILAVFDYVFQWWDYEKNLKMSKHEVKEEYKQMEGNPLIKAKIKQKQRQMSASRMMKDIPKADVVITNPTHFAVALKYEPEKNSAPMVIAKGQDYLALRIKEIAKDNSVEIVENKPLARTLYSTVEVGDAVPQELYQAVAEVLAFVYSLKDKKPAV